jgi:hypothetical protein
LPFINLIGPVGEHYTTKNCQETPSQYISTGIPANTVNSLIDMSAGKERKRAPEEPNITFIHDLKKKVGPSK